MWNKTAATKDSDVRKRDKGMWSQKSKTQLQLHDQLRDLELRILCLQAHISLPVKWGEWPVFHRMVLKNKWHKCPWELSTQDQAVLRGLNLPSLPSRVSQGFSGEVQGCRKGGLVRLSTSGQNTHEIQGKSTNPKSSTEGKET